MLESLGRIKNPLVRSIAAAATVGSVITLSAAVVIGVTNAKAKSAVLDVQKSIPAVLISNGVGITPMISMAKACTLLNPTRPIWFVHGARDGNFHAFRDEVREISRQNHNLNVHFRYSRPTSEDRGKYHSVGYVDAALIQELVRQDAQFRRG
ncbi:ferredoxin reductase domain-containing protein [Nostoc sp.]